VTKKRDSPKNEERVTGPAPASTVSGVDKENDWDREAENWVRWARTPGHDAYWQYRDAFFEQMVPPPGRRTVEIGCGEGRVARDLQERGHRVVAVDRSLHLLGYAKGADPMGVFVLANAARLPVADASCDLVIAYNSLMDVADMPTTVAEAARILEPGGRFCVCVTHPLNDAGHFVTTGSRSVFEIAGSYFGRRDFDGTFERDGLTMTFRGWSYALEEYMRAFEQAALLVEAVREPVPAATTDHYSQWHRIPMFLNIRLVKQVTSPSATSAAGPMGFDRPARNHSW
jgi:SAM-dependent methyltransferase